MCDLTHKKELLHFSCLFLRKSCMQDYSDAAIVYVK